MGFSCSERLAGTYLVPHPWPTMPSWPTVERIERVGLTALAAPPDFLALDKVATVVQERYAQVLWIRLQIADADPGACSSHCSAQRRGWMRKRRKGLPRT